MCDRPEAMSKLSVLAEVAAMPRVPSLFPHPLYGVVYTALQVELYRNRQEQGKLKNLL